MPKTLPDEASHIRYDLVGEAVRIVLNRPDQLNALSPAMALDLTAALGKAVDGGARAVLITGAGRAFCSGASLEKAPTVDADAKEAIDRCYIPLARALADLPVPLITAVNGVAAGAGAAIALSGDLILAAKSASFMLAFARIGLVPDLGATWLVARSAGRVRALEMALLGDRMPAEEAQRIGLITKVVDDAALTREAEQLCTRLSGMPTRALGLIRQQIRAALESSFEQSLLVEREHQRVCARSEDFKEGTAAFREKRSPVFSGR